MIGITPTSVATSHEMRDLVTASTTLIATTGLDRKRAYKQAVIGRGYLSVAAKARFAE